MRWANIQLKIPENWMSEIITDKSIGIEKIHVLNCRSYKYRGGTGVVKIISKENNLNTVQNFIENHDNVYKSNFYQMSDKILLGEITLDKCSACIALNKSECLMISSQSKKDHIQWTVAAEKNNEIFDLIFYLKSYGCDAQLIKITSPDNFSITDRQKELLKYAYSKGFFENPKKIKLRDISNTFNISASTASEILRSGQRKIFAEYFKESIDIKNKENRYRQKKIV